MGAGPMDHSDTLLVVVEDASMFEAIADCFDGLQCIHAADASAAITELRRYEPAVVLLQHDLAKSGSGPKPGLEMLREILSLAPYVRVISLVPERDRHHAMMAISQGACDYFEQPIEAEPLRFLVNRAFRNAELEAKVRLSQLQTHDSPLDGIVAASESMLGVCRMIEKVAPTDVSTLLLGESGTGKELLARALHKCSGRKDRPFVAINCAAIPENLLESELFGHEKGAFTGAVKTTPGKVEVADGGTLFLDEIGDMPMPLQAKLLRFLQERVIERVGGRQEIPVDVRVVCATNQKPERLIDEGLFREDLYYRIAEITINIPPFRDREEGRVILARTLLQQYAKKQKRAVSGFTDDAIRAIEAYRWPGNVRELENKIKSAVIMADGKLVTPLDLGLSNADGDDDNLNLREVRQRAETKAIRVALARSYGNISKTAELLGITRPTLYDLLSKYGLSAEGYSKKAAGT